MKYTTSSAWYQYTTLAEPTVRIVVKTKNGWHPIQVYKDKDNKSWVEAKDGAEFGLEIKNNNPVKLLAVSSVDGLNVITGKPAEIKNESGYVINGYSKIVIDGWRISDNSVKAFTFTKNKKESYASKLGADITNLGCLGFAFFSEFETYSAIFNGTSKYRADPMHFNNTMLSRSTNHVSLTSFNSVSDESFSMGTAMGEEKESSVEYVNNTFQLMPFSKQTFYYDSKENLIKNGIIVEKKMPEPFLNDGYCKIV